MPYILIVVSGMLLPSMVGCDSSNNVSLEADRLVVTLNENPDPLHSDFTPSVNRLIDLGKDAIPAMLSVMADGDSASRKRAQTVLEGVTMRMCGFIPGKEGWSVEQQQHWRELWLRLGNLDYSAPEQRRLEVVALWRDWLAGGLRGQENGTGPIKK